MADLPLSVMMSVRNGEAYLKEAMDSVLSQDFGDFEFLITDDASTDGTADLLAAYARGERRITVFKQPNHAGLAVALEHMTPRATGQFVARMDADDVSLPGRFKAQVARLRRDPGLGVLGTWARLILSDGQPFEERCFPDDDAWIRRRLVRGANVLCHGSLMFRRDVLAKIKPPVWRFGFAEDFDLLLRLTNLAKFGLVEQVLYLWRRHATTMCLAATQEKYEKMNRVILELHALRAKGLPEFDWRAREQNILELKDDPVLTMSWESYRQGRSALAAGDARTARHGLRAAIVNPRIRAKAVFLFCLACLPGRLGILAARFIDHLEWLWNPHSKYIRRIPPAG